MATIRTASERYRKIKDFGGWREIENYIVAPNLGNTSGRAQRQKPTKAAVQKVNQRHAVERCEDKIRANFLPGDKFITLTFADSCTCQSRHDASRAYDAFIKRLRRRCDKSGIEVKFCKTIERGERTGRWHIHAIINDDVPYELIRSCWSKCGSVFVTALWGDNSGFANVHNLAEYFVGVHKKGKCIGDKPKSERTYSFSANCVEPVVTYEPMSAKWLDTPRIPCGWKLADNSLEEYIDAYGLKHQRYTIIKLFDDVISKAEARMAWESEQQGERRKDIAKKLSVSERTLTQSYTHYKLIKTKRE